MKYPKIECEYCNRLVSNTNIKRHLDYCSRKIIGTCPVCGNPTKEGSATCSYSCANTFFRTSEGNGRYKSDEEVQYRQVCFRHHEKKCVICPEDKIVAVHHFDENRANNDWKNLIPICPTHHTYMHSKWKYLIDEKVKEYHQRVSQRI
jgi:hypothetical protein